MSYRCFRLSLLCLSSNMILTYFWVKQFILKESLLEFNCCSFSVLYVGTSTLLVFRNSFLTATKALTWFFTCLHQTVEDPLKNHSLGLLFLFLNKTFRCSPFSVEHSLIFSTFFQIFWTYRTPSIPVVWLKIMLVQKM